MGLPAALIDDMTYCPQCKGNFAIRPDGTGAHHMERAYAYNDDLTACGARLISSVKFQSERADPPPKPD